MGRREQAAERDTKRAALFVEDDPAFQVVARAGYAVSGLLHVLIGAIALTTVFGPERGRADQTGALVKVVEVPAGAVLLCLDRAFDAIAALPFGEVLIVIVGVGFIAYGVYCGFRAWLARL
jgi:hypothetical protein